MPLLSPLAMFDRRRSLKERHHVKTLDAVKSQSLKDAAETCSSSSESDEFDNVEVPLLISKSCHKRSVSSLYLQGHFASQLENARQNTSQTSLLLKDFVQHSTRHELYALRNLLALQDRTWEAVTIQETVPVAQIRCWSYKKENAEHHLRKLCQCFQIPLEFEIHLEVLPSHDATQVLPLLHQARKDRDIASLALQGYFTLEQTQDILQTLTSLFHLEDTWKQIHIALALANQDQTTAWRETMMAAMQTFSQLYIQMGIPVDIRPCTSF
jgi:hypothetical protein